ncbi:MAG: DUF1080 domain-containing protein, partial [Schlesneria sp.]
MTTRQKPAGYLEDFTVRVISFISLALFVGILHGAEDDGFVPLFNGRDLQGWIPVNVAPSTFTAKDGLIVSTGVPTGTLRTDRMYENFVVELEWRHLKAGGNAGLFIWADPITYVGVPFSRGVEV